MIIYYWCPFIAPVATVKAVINSAISLKNYSNKKYEPRIINVAGEWNVYKNKLTENNINLIKLTNSNIISNKNFNGFLKSRVLYVYIFFIAFFPLLKLLKKNPSSYLIIHLITSLPLLINYLFNIKTKVLLRISGLPKLNLLRHFYWKLVLKKIYLVTCPTKATCFFLKKINFINNERIKVLFDPIISPKAIIESKINNNLNLKNYFLAVGRLTRQKNFIFLLEVFKEFNFNKNYKLVIIGEGEQKNLIETFIKKNKMENCVKLLNYTDNIFNYYKNSKCFVLTSLWEDPGFVLVEACYMNTPIISSNCKNGPEEILNYGKNGILFDSNNKKSLLNAFERFSNLEKKELRNLIFNAKKYSRQFSVYNHYKLLVNLL